MNEEWEKWLNRYRFHLGAVLVLIIIAGGLILLWQRSNLNHLLSNFQKSDKTETENLKIENQDLQEKIAQLEEENKKLKEAGNQEGEVAGTSTESSSEDISGKININSASAQELDKLPGIGPTKAQAIIAYRQTNSGFKSIEEIKNVKGIGEVTFAKMKDMITVGN